ncbi:hypothetical protein ABBQ32_005728 [Trebouxia sp. C0010 RCD-2024]
MESQQRSLSIDDDIAETQKLLTIVTRPIVRDRLLQLLGSLQQSKLQLVHEAGQQVHSHGGQAYSSGYAAGFSFASSLSGEQLQLAEQIRSPDLQGNGLQGSGTLSPYDPVWSAPLSTSQKATGGSSVASGHPLSLIYGGGDASVANQLTVRDAANGMQATVSNNSPVLPAFAYGMNLQLVRGQPQMPMEPFRILTTCSWEQNAYTVKIYVPLHGVKTDLLRAVFQPHTLDIKAINLQGKNYIFSIKQTYRPVNPDGCSVVASKTKKNILITISKAQSNTQEEKHWRDLQR